MKIIHREYDGLKFRVEIEDYWLRDHPKAPKEYRGLVHLIDKIEQMEWQKLMKEQESKLFGVEGGD